MAITVGSVEVDVVPNTRGIYQRLRSQLVPEASRAGQDAGEAAGRRFGPAMADAAGGSASVIGQRIGRQIGQRIVAEISDSIRDGINNGGRAGRPAATRQGSESGGAFARAARARIEAAMRNLPDVEIGADTTPAQAEILRLRAQLARLADQEIGVDISSGAAMAEIERIRARLQALSASDADVQVRVDAGQAMAELAAVGAMMSALDRRDIDINVSTRQARMAVLVLAAAIGSLVAIPAVPVLAAGIGSITAAALAAGAGVGALAAAAVPAVMDIANALKAQKAASDAAATATAKGGQTAAQAAQKATQLEGAQQALATAHRNAARQIGQAEQGVSDAVRQAAENSEQAAQQVQDAKSSLASAVEQAADRQRAAAEQVENAEDSLADAQRTARQAQRDLTAARREAAEELVDLGNRLAGAQLSERDAVLDAQEAMARLNAVKAAGSNATLLEQQRAQLAYDQAVQRLKEQKLETTRLAAEKKAADRAGVVGSEQVRTAQQRLADSQESVRDRARDLADAQREAARQQVQSQQDIAAAQQRVAEAQRNVVRVQEDGARSVARAQEQLVVAQQSAADSIAGAQRQIRSAQLSAAGGADQAAVAQAKYQAALAAMSPAARGTFNAFVRLRTAFKGWSRELQPTIMPLFTRGINGLRRALPGLTPFVIEAAKAVGELQNRAARGFQSKGWKTFKKDLTGSVRPAIVGLGVALGNIAKGLGGIVAAFLPHMDSISDRMVGITERFANWGTSLKGSPEFEGFLDYSSRMAPVLAAGLGDIGRAFYEVSKSLAPLSGPALETLGALARGVASIAETLPWLVQGIYLVIIATKAWTLVQWLLNAAFAASGITLIIIAIVALVAAVVYAYKRFGWFRAGVQAAWEGIKTAALAAWNAALKPVFEAIGTIVMWLWTKIIKPYFDFVFAYYRLLGRIALWLWQTIFEPVFKAIGKIVKFWYQQVIKRFFSLVKFYFQTIGAIVIWFWRKVFQLAFKAISTIIRLWWTQVVKRYFGLVRAAIRVLADVFRWLWRKVVTPVFNGIRSVIKGVWEKGIRPAFNALKTAIGRVADAFRTAKDAIGRAWDKIKGLTKKPINFVLNTVWNKGIVKVWKKIGGWIPGLPDLKTVPLLERGGAIPAQPGVFNRPTAIVGEGRGSHPEYVIPTDPKYRSRALGLWQQAGGQLMEDGGIVGKLGRLVGIGTSGTAKGAKFLSDPVGNLGRLLDPLLKPLRKIGDTGWGQMVLALPKTIISGLKGLVSGAAGGGAKVADALRWARTQAGKPYQWGGNGNPSWDCSGFVSAIESVIRGQKPHRRWSTHAFAGGAAPPGWKRGLRAPYQIGVTHSGVGHTAGTLGGVNVESRGGDGVLVGGRARGANHPMFSSVYGFAPSIGGGSITGIAGAKSAAREMLGQFGWGDRQWPPLDKLWTRESGWRWNARNPSSGAFGIPQSLPAWKMASAGADWRTNPATQIKWGLGYIDGRYGNPAGAWAHSQRVGWYDDGGWLPPGGLGFNGLSRPEAVLTPQQFKAMEGAASTGVTASGGGDFTGDLYLDSGEFLGQVRGVVQHENRELASALRSGRTGR
ncbi:hypothetical protein [Streptomyces phytophilus]|uniref:aggregation-promoting factor C-terminal-like domain-containing protein n=1 Tax=Streptomyces phytophilus TaxID=722715 RepID=UPI0015F07573|nr:hypothetical protein [Streptomyces phytophilus]